MDLKVLIREIHSLSPCQQEMVAVFVDFLLYRNSQPSQQPTYKPIWQEFDEIIAGVPEEEWKNVPYNVPQKLDTALRWFPGWKSSTLGVMMGTTRRRFTAEMKASAALAAIKGQQTINEIAADYGVHPNQVAKWKKQVLEQATTLFAHPASTTDEETLKDRLYQEIGQLKVELDWLKKKCGRER